MFVITLLETCQLWNTWRRVAKILFNLNFFKLFLRVRVSTVIRGWNFSSFWQWKCLIRGNTPYVTAHNQERKKLYRTIFRILRSQHRDFFVFKHNFLGWLRLRFLFWSGKIPCYITNGTPEVQGPLFLIYSYGNPPEVQGPDKHLEIHSREMTP